MKHTPTDAKGRSYQDAPHHQAQPIDLLDEAVHALDLKGRMERHPYQTVLAAAGIGFIASGALFTRFSANVLRMGLRIAAMPLLEQHLQAMAQSAVRPPDPEASPTPGHPPKHRAQPGAAS